MTGARITARPANGFDTRVTLVCVETATRRPAWARFTVGSDYVETIQIRRNGDFGGLIIKMHESRVELPETLLTGD